MTPDRSEIVPQADTCRIKDYVLFSDDKCTQVIDTEQRQRQDYINQYANTNINSQECQYEDQTKDPRKVRRFCTSPDTFKQLVYNLERDIDKNGNAWENDKYCTGRIYHDKSGTFQSGVCTQVDKNVWSIYEVVPNFNSEAWLAAIDQYKSQNPDDFNEIGQYIVV